MYRGIASKKISVACSTLDILELLSVFKERILNQTKLDLKNQ